MVSIRSLGKYVKPRTGSVILYKSFLILCFNCFYIVFVLLFIINLIESNFVELKKYSNSQTFFEGTAEEWISEDSVKNRLFCLVDFLKTVLIFPFALIYKGTISIARAFVVCFALLALIVGLGQNVEARQFFVERLALLAKDLADWILLPLALVQYSARFLMGLFYHPRFYFSL